MNLTFEEAGKSYIKYLYLKNKPQSAKKIESRLNNHILNEYQNKNIFEFTKIDYLDWQNRIERKDLKYGYKKSLHNCFVALLNHCVMFYNLNENVASKVGNFKNREIIDKGNIWNIEEFNNFISVVDDNIYKTLYLFLYFTGCRIGEALALTYNDINDNIITINKTISREYYNGHKIISTPKTLTSNRKIIIDDLLRKEIENLKFEYNNFNNNMFIFGGNKSLSTSTITRRKNEYCKKANVKQIKMHEFRHSHACLLYKNDVPISDISHRLGHSNMTMTINVYLRNVEHNEKRVLKTLNQIRLN